MSIHPQIIEKNGRKEFAVLPYHEFVQLKEELEDFADLKMLRNKKATSSSEPTRPLHSIIREIEAE